MPHYRNKRPINLIDVTQTVKDSMQHLDNENGEIGIEIEVEGKSLPRRFPAHWRVTRDGSLRGEEAYEYVIKKPLTRKQMPNALKVITKGLEDAKSTVIDSGRCGVHVHLNFQKVALRNLTSMICLYYLFEDALTQYCGEGRTGNLFCLGTKYAENTMDAFTHFILYGSVNAINDDEIRYASLNLKALVSYGSLEFRSMRGTVEEEVISDWVNILLKLKDASLKYDNPRKILEDFSRMGAPAFTKHIFGAYAEKVMKYTDNDTMQEALWRIQPICYVRDWGKVQRPKHRSNLVEEPDIAGLPGGGGKRLKRLGDGPVPPQPVQPLFADVDMEVVRGGADPRLINAPPPAQFQLRRVAGGGADAEQPVRVGLPQEMHENLPFNVRAAIDRENNHIRAQQIVEQANLNNDREEFRQGKPARMAFEEAVRILDKLDNPPPPAPPAPPVVGYAEFVQKFHELNELDDDLEF